MAVQIEALLKVFCGLNLGRYLNNCTEVVNASVAPADRLFFSEKIGPHERHGNSWTKIFRKAPRDTVYLLDDTGGIVTVVGAKDTTVDGALARIGDKAESVSFALWVSSPFKKNGGGNAGVVLYLVPGEISLSRWRKELLEKENREITENARKIAGGINGKQHQVKGMGANLGAVF